MTETALTLHLCLTLKFYLTIWISVTLTYHFGVVLLHIQWFPFFLQLFLFLLNLPVAHNVGKYYKINTAGERHAAWSESERVCSFVLTICSIYSIPAWITSMILFFCSGSSRSLYALSTARTQKQ